MAVPPLEPDPGDGSVAVFFDLDHTLIDASSGVLYYKYLWRLGEIRGLDLLRIMWHLFEHRMNWLDVESLVRREMARYAGVEETRIREGCRAWFAEYVQHRVYADALETIDAHRGAGHHAAILSAASPYVCRPMQEHLGIDAVLCTVPVVEDNRFTGELLEPYCYGDGKVVWAERHAAERGLDLDRSYFYTDSFSDLPMIERIGHPRIVNPDPKLRALARTRGWPVLRWTATAAPVPQTA